MNVLEISPANFVIWRRYVTSLHVSVEVLRLYAASLQVSVEVLRLYAAPLHVYGKVLRLYAAPLHLSVEVLQPQVSSFTLRIEVLRLRTEASLAHGPCRITNDDTTFKNVILDSDFAKTIIAELTCAQTIQRF